jgi:hypothetical protein
MSCLPSSTANDRAGERVEAAVERDHGLDCCTSHSGYSADEAKNMTLIAIAIAGAASHNLK